MLRARHHHEGDDGRPRADLGQRGRGHPAHPHDRQARGYRRAPRRGRQAAAKLGKGAERFALHVKGQELPMHDPRGKKGLSLAYALSPTGADHMEAPHDPLYAGFHPQGHPLGVLGLIEPLDPLSLDAKKVRAFFETQKVWSAYNSVGMCDFVGAPLNGLELQPMIDYINAVTGWNISLYGLMKVGERNNTLA